MGASVIIVIILSFGCLLFPKSKIIAICFFLLMWTLWGWNTWNGDFDAYQLRYENSIENFTFGYEFGYNGICVIFNYLNFSFQTYLISISAIVLFVAYKFGCKYTNYIALYSLGYFFIFILEFVFIRNYLAHTISLLAFSQLVNKNNLKFVVYILAACTIHISSVVFIVFLVANLNFSFRKILVIVLLFIVIIIAGLKGIATYLGGTYISRFEYYSEGVSSGRIIVFHLFFVVCTYLYYSHFLYRSNTVITIEKVNVISLIYLGIYYYIPYYARFLKYLFVLNIILFLWNLSNEKHQINVVKYLLSIAYISFLIYYTIYTSLYKYTIQPLFNCNLIWGDNLTLHAL